MNCCYLLSYAESDTQALNYFKYLLLLSGHPSKYWASLSLFNLSDLIGDQWFQYDLTISPAYIPLGRFS